MGCNALINTSSGLHAAPPPAAIPPLQRLSMAHTITQCMSSMWAVNLCISDGCACLRLCKCCCMPCMQATQVPTWQDQTHPTGPTCLLLGVWTVPARNKGQLMSPLAETKANITTFIYGCIHAIHCGKPLTRYITAATAARFLVLHTS